MIVDIKYFLSPCDRQDLYVPGACLNPARWPVVTNMLVNALFDNFFPFRKVNNGLLFSSSTLSLDMRSLSRLRYVVLLLEV
jgi:hypothetical protein